MHALDVATHPPREFTHCDFTLTLQGTQERPAFFTQLAEKCRRTFEVERFTLITTGLRTLARATQRFSPVGLARAREDLLVAQLLLPHEVYNSVACHCQQAAEKALKAVQVARGAMPHKSHDLLLLLIACRESGAAFADDLSVACRILTPFASVSRYPGWGHVSRQQATEAIAFAQEIVFAAVAIA